MSQETKAALIASGKVIFVVAVQAAFTQLLIEVQKHMGLNQPNR